MKFHQKSMCKLIGRYVRRPLTGAEIGVFRGDTARIIHAQWPACRMLLVDPWREVAADDSYAIGGGHMGSMTQAEWDAIYDEAMVNIACSGGPSLVWRMTSAEAAAIVPDWSLDFVFIDADHTYEGTLRDIALWLPKCRKLIMGHDYNAKAERFLNLWGVKKAVDTVFGEERVFKRKGYVWAFRIPRHWRNRQKLQRHANHLVDRLSRLSPTHTQEPSPSSPSS